MWGFDLNSGIFFSDKFQDAAGEDINFCLDALMNGFNIESVDNTSIFHLYGYNQNQSLNLASFMSRFERYGRGEYKVLQNHPYYYFLLNQTKERQSLLKNGKFKQVLIHA